MDPTKSKQHKKSKNPWKQYISKGLLVVAGEGLMIMTVGEQIKVLCVRCGISVSELSRRLGKTNQAFGQKIKRGTFTVDEMKEVAAAVGCSYEGAFILPD